MRYRNAIIIFSKRKNYITNKGHLYYFIAKIRNLEILSCRGYRTKNAAKKRAEKLIREENNEI